MTTESTRTPANDTGGSWNIPVKYRAYAYRVLGTLSALGVAYGLITEDKVGLWVAAASAVLGLPVAAANTSTKS